MKTITTNSQILDINNKYKNWFKHDVQMTKEDLDLLEKIDLNQIKVVTESQYILYKLITSINPIETIQKYSNLYFNEFENHDNAAKLIKQFDKLILSIELE